MAKGNERPRLRSDQVLDLERGYFESCPDDQERSEGGLSALCLSGGGIRSASFCLGALQELSRKGLLGRFHYLSTVSGGGFAGGWLQTLIHEQGGIAKAEKQLRKPDALEALRAYTNYLTPEPGAFSPDTWASVVLYVRNLLLIWLVLIPVFLLLTIGVVAYRTALEAVAKPDVYGHLIGLDHVGERYLPWIAMGIASVALFTATVSACLLLPSHRPRSGGSTRYGSARRIFWLCVIPAMLWAAITPATLRTFFEPDTAFLLTGDVPPSHQLRDLAMYPALAYLCVQVLAYAAAASYQAALLFVARRMERQPRPDLGRQRGLILKRAGDLEELRSSLHLYRVNFWAWFVASATASLLMWLGAWSLMAQLAAPVPASLVADAHVSQSLAVLGPPTLVFGHLLQSVFFVGLRRRARVPDLDREWIARADGQVLLLTCCWATLSFCCLSLAEAAPTILGTSDMHLWPTWAASVVAALSGPAAAWLGKQVFTRAQASLAEQAPERRLTIGLDLLAVSFAACLFAYLGGLVQWTLGVAQVAVGSCPADRLGKVDFLFRCGRPELYQGSPLLLQAAAAVLLSCLVVAFGSVNVNRFSLHGVYRNRLSRAFLGSARVARDADPFTDFDDGDSPRLARLITPERRLLPVINMTLNLTQIRRHAWAERKAAPFTATPFACGSAALDPAGGADPDTPRGAFVRTEDYAGRESRRDQANARAGTTLGGLLTISGAAVSPNWGYHSSPVIAFLMTMFNVRLGAWLPNPARATDLELTLSKPSNSVAALLDELTGRSTDARQAIYLSDGGHFDNLGLYEMLRRRCTSIVVVDAGQDESCTLSDLGSAVRKAAIDGLAEVDLNGMRMMSRKQIEAAAKDATPATTFAMGTIRYVDPEQVGSLLYIKPSFTADVPASVRAYGMNNPSFPHESTTRQWFSESQFESYRALGEYQLRSMFSGTTPASLRGWLEQLRCRSAKAAPGQEVPNSTGDARADTSPPRRAG